MNCQTIRESIDTATRRAGYSESVHAHLGGCHDCRRHAGEMSSLLALLNATPRVEAPADFDFRLRARIARAKSEPRMTAGLVTTLGRFWSQSFSLGQAAAAMAAIAVALTASTIYFTNPNEVATPGGGAMAVNTAPVQSPGETAVASVSKPAQSLRANRAASARTPARSARPQTIQPAGLTTAAAVIARADHSSSFYANGQVVRTAPNRDLIGAEAALAKSQPALSF